MTAIKHSWSLVIFGYNERPNLEQLIIKAQDVLKVIASEYEIIIVDDGSVDGSPAHVKELVNKYKNIKSVIHSSNLGIGQALLSGYNIASKDYVCCVPADGQFDINELLQIQSLNEEEFVSFYRITKPGYSIFRKFVSCLNKALNRFLLNIELNDVNWVKVYHTNKIRHLNLKIKSSLVETEICSKLIRCGAKPIQIGSQYLPRATGRSRGASIKTIWKATSDIISLLIVVHLFSCKSLYDKN